MDPFDFQHRPPPHGETWSSLPMLHWLLEKQHELAQNVAALLANQSTNKADILEHLRMHREHHDQRLEDFKDEVIPRLAKLELLPSKPAPESSLARSLFGSIGVGLFSVIPWKHVWLMCPGILLAISSNVAPDGTKRWILGVVEFFWKTSSP